METPLYRVTLRFVKILNVILMTIPFMICWDLYYINCLEIEDQRNISVLILVIFVLLYMIYGRIYGSFLVSLVRISEMIYSQSLAILMTNSIMFIIVSFVMHHIVDARPIIIVSFTQFILSVCWCLGAHVWYFKTFPPRRTVIIHDQKQNIENLIHAYGLRKKFCVKKTMTVEESISERFLSLNGIETVFLCGVHSHDRNIILKYCVENNIVVYVLPRIGDVIMSGARRMHLFHLPFLRVGRYDPAPEYLFFKRVFDILISSVALLVLSPIMIITAIAIKMTDGGPVLYKQKRLTKNRREFYVLKFRSMRIDAEKDGIARLSTGKSDDRITPVGKIIRKVRIDELPQLLNILEGSMSIVGPRPERPEIAY